MHQRTGKLSQHINRLPMAAISHVLTYTSDTTSGVAQMFRNAGIRRCPAWQGVHIQHSLSENGRERTGCMKNRRRRNSHSRSEARQPGGRHFVLAAGVSPRWIGRFGTGAAERRHHPFHVFRGKRLSGIRSFQALDAASRLFSSHSTAALTFGTKKMRR